MDTIIRTPAESIKPDEAPAAPKVDSTPIETGIEVPYTDYQKAHGKPFSVKHYDLGEYWEEGFSDEIGTIEQYLTNKIEDGEIANSVTAVEKELKDMEKLHGISKEERSVIKIGVLSNYMKFLLSTKDLKQKVKKYGYY